MSRTTSLTAQRGLLEDLRAGVVTFDFVARCLRGLLAQRAERFIRLWSWSGQTSIEVDDLVQEMLVGLWRAVDSWDPSRSGIVRYVDSEIGRAAQKRLRQATGYPDPRRRDVARQVSVEQAALERMADERGFAAHDHDDVEAFDAAKRVEELLNGLTGLDRHVVELVLQGATSEEVTLTIYADTEARIDYRMDSVPHARRMVGLALRRALTKEIEGGSTW